MAAVLGSATNIIVKLHDRMDSATKMEAFALFQTGADYGHPTSMTNLGVFYNDGQGVAQDYVKARILFRAET
jgi:TPR repeat protein